MESPLPQVDAPPAAAPPLLAARDITKSYGGVHAVSGVTLEFPAGSVTAIVGDNGAGKSTLIKILSGALHPDEGRLEIDGIAVRFTAPAQARAAGIETVYQDLALADHRDVTENLFMGRELTRGWGPFRLTDIGAMRRQTAQALEDLNVKVPSVRQQIRRLSGGQRQGVAIGRAVHWGSRVLIMDEPMAALGLQEAGRVQDLVLRLSERGLTQIIVSHNLDHVFTLSTRIAVMRLGRLVGIRPTAETDHEEIVRMVAGLADRPAANAVDRPAGSATGG
jgi:simple sugar transport system ATP-binding protein